MYYDVQLDYSYSTVSELEEMTITITPPRPLWPDLEQSLPDVIERNFVERQSESG